MEKYGVDIYLGTTDVNRGGRVYTTEELQQEISRYLIRTETGFSLSDQVGGYLYADGSFIIENSVRISLLDPPEEAVLAALVAHLKQTFHQETVLVVRTRLEMKYYQDGIRL